MSFVINLYIVILFADVILSYMPQFQRASWRIWIKKASDLTCSPIRKFLPKNTGLDFSPMIVLFSLKFLESLIFNF